MKKIVFLLTALLTLTSCSVLGNINWDSAQLGQAAGAAMTAMSITDDQIIQLCAQSIAQEDASNRIDNGTYAARLKRVLSGVKINGLTLDPKVYIKNEINAFASGDGSIRVYSGLMDVMNDEELFAIIGHEIGHVVNQDTKKAMKSAYLAAAARGVVNAAGSIGVISQSVLGDIGQAYFNSQYSQKQELAADKFGFEFTVAYNKNPYAMYNSLIKLQSLSTSRQSSYLDKMFSSHPDNETRAKKVKEMADNYVKSKK
jgi:putative metalloprotease